MAASISAISFYLPECVESNLEVGLLYPEWDVPRVVAKTGIRSRHVAGPGICASDLAYEAARRLLQSASIPLESIDCLVLCTQSPDYFLPATACLLQDRLGLPSTCAAFDINQGCSGYVYGLFLAKGLVESGLARYVLLLTGETYSKYVHPADRTNRLLFGDAGSATLVANGGSGAAIGNFVMGTDGRGASNLIVEGGAHRHPERRCRGDQAGPENLYMNGPEVFAFSLRRVPEVVNALLDRSNLTIDEIDRFVFHQANAFMNETLRAKLKIPRAKYPLVLDGYGNTVSNTLPIVLHESGGFFSKGEKVMLVGFGVGYS